MKKFIKLTSDDVALLCSIPKAGGDLGLIIKCYVFLHRDAPPSRNLVEECFSKALAAGIISREGKQFEVEKDWYPRIHRDGDCGYALLFEEEFVGKEIEIIREVDFSVNEREYKKIKRRSSPGSLAAFLKSLYDQVYDLFGIGFGSKRTGA